jgi:hypothetical protein
MAAYGEILMTAVIGAKTRPPDGIVAPSGAPHATGGITVGHRHPDLPDNSYATARSGPPDAY